MGFRPLSERSVRWRALEGEGLEHLHIAPTADGILARSAVVGEVAGRAYGVRYEVRCDSSWRVLSFEVETTDGRRLALTSDGKGHWRGEDGALRPDLGGCIDIDLSGSPFTNTLPIRRLAPTPETGTLELTMLYVPFDTFVPFPDGQRYTALGEGRYLYQASDGTFEAEISVDEDAIVLDYPTLFRRL